MDCLDGHWMRASSAALALTLAAGAARSDTFAGLSLKIPNEAAPAGGTFQMLVTVTEPAPIIIGRMSAVAGLSLQGVVLPGNPDAAGTAVRGPAGIVLRTLSPGGAMGLSTVAPIVTVTYAVPASSATGTTIPLTLDLDASSWLGPLGVYPVQLKPGKLTVRAVPFIADVLPGGGFLPAGSAVTVVGGGFQDGAVAEIDGIEIGSVRFVDATRLELVTATAAQLDGRRVVVRNPDRSRADYYSYLRAVSLGESARPLLAATEPVFPVHPVSLAIFDPPPSGFFGLALQNPGAADAQVTVELITAGAAVGSASLVLPPRTELVRDASELFGAAPAPGQLVRLTAAAQVQALGLAGDDALGSVAPVLPAVSF